MLIGEAGQVYRRAAPQGKMVNSVGAGDSMVAGFLAGYESSGGNLEEALKLGRQAKRAAPPSGMAGDRAGNLVLYEEQIPRKVREIPCVLQIY